MDTKWQRNSATHVHIVFKKAERVITANSEKVIRHHNLTPSQFSVVDILYTKGEMRVSRLLEKILATSGNMTVILRNMERDGLIYRNCYAKDKRVSVIGLTEKGRKLFEKILPDHKKDLEKLYSILTDEEKVTFISIMKKFKEII
ncbi:MULTISPECIES: MarR family winged helix-turn-helix transcriptional regulator [unclassified Gemella]|uniref:MarR family winged helix-turn-helix transcriptional regulator n=1 Tax=unclassified Gemella TaxID=2624949 RepID=UPI0010739F0E|nr:MULTISPECIES: MarR family transcriptional regulator [unclassified Gemella]MBF0709890.1 MarR family transcriptional regulator [Gemella sp. GL1.1]MBF0746806.1 MarR family transcriptional regulator [Gemella sp. 19428wG2_WT2a]NYS27234.1 MarR family transcriptional regulator [Gemella sp. GL1]TFU59531.1 MarR family transcriptional regulator [Gemella sp. WT2a]